MSLCRICALIAIAFLLRIIFGVYRPERSTAAGGAQSVENIMIGERPTGYWWYKQVSVPVRQRFLKAHAAPQGLCENMINALEQLAKQQKDGGCPIQSIVTGFCERSRKGIMEGLRNFIKVDNHCALTWAT